MKDRGDFAVVGIVEKSKLLDFSAMLVLLLSPF